ncbi:uncharacterized protein LOC122014912 isoform X2 [Zingiber officinale]|uniref:uncharacterized protein LOC122014912 isoform X2 n=1 Tax=Zingiber officinale TaxID=94328 RepID=UPI001C4AFA4B|nr:uncharacterized protein LOC122014912 isoform X2 [Zingiber officinale]
MDESEKDAEGSRGLMRSRRMANRSSPATRQQRMGSSSPTVSNDNGDCSFGDGVNDNVAMVRRKKVKINPSRWRSSNKDASGDAGGSDSEAEDFGSFQPMFSATCATSLPSQKKERIQRKVAEESDSVDPALVPRKLRSAINKRSRGPLSLAIPNAKKKHCQTFNRLPGFPRNGGRKCKQNQLFEAFTKDEEVVIEALCELSKMLPIGAQTADKEDRKALDNHQIYLASCSEGSKVDKNLLQQALADESKNTSSCLVKPLEDEKIEVHAPSEQSTAVCQKKTADSNLNRTPELTLIETEHPENAPSITCMSISRRPGVLHRCCTGNRVIQPAEQVECNNEGTPSQIQKSSSSTVWSRPRNNITGLSSKVIDLPTEKVPLGAIPTWKKCAIHVFIGHNIKSYQDKERQCRLSSVCDESKQGERKSCALANNERAGSQSGSSGMASAAISLVERNKHDGRNGILCYSRQMQAQQYSGLLDVKQKPVCDFLSLSSGGDSVHTADGAKFTGQLHSPNLHTHVPQHSLMPFPFHSYPYALPYSEKLLPVATQQVQLQAPHFMGNQFYRPQMDSTISNIQLQQQYQLQLLWQAHYANYRPPADARRILSPNFPSPTSSAYC